MNPIYLDYHATTPVAPEVLDAMIPWFTDHFGNPSSRSHAYGWKASEAVEIARLQVAQSLDVDEDEIIFTSGSTESLNTAIKGFAEPRSGHIITIATAHPAVLDPLAWLEKRGVEVTRLPVDRGGLLDPDQFRDAIKDDTSAVVMMWGNNETGVIQDMQLIGTICQEAGVPLIADTTQAFGKIETNPRKMNVDMLSLSGHKVFGPKGVGVLYLNKNLKHKPRPLLHGGGHENGFRSGTLNVTGIVGLGKAAEISASGLLATHEQIKSLRDHLEGTIMSRLKDVTVNGHHEHRLPTVTNISVTGVESQAVMSRFRAKLAISSGSACSSANPKPSHVLLAMGLSEAEAKSSFRFSLGRPTTKAEIDQAAEIFIDAVNKEREISPIWQMMERGIDLN